MATNEGEPIWPSASHPRAASPPPTRSSPQMPSFSTQLENDHIRKIASHVAKELRNQNFMDQAQITQFSKMIQQGFEKLSQQMTQLAIRVSRIEDQIQ